MENPFSELPADAAGCNLIEEPFACKVSDLFNASYGLMVEILMRFFAHTEETHEELHALVTTALGLMQRVLKPLGSILTLLPATGAGDAPRAGASFAFHRSIDYLPHREAAWIVFAERLGELTDFSAELAAGDQRGLGLDNVHATIQALAVTVSRLAAARDRRVGPHAT
jgi:hypothetical protein